MRKKITVIGSARQTAINGSMICENFKGIDNSVSHACVNNIRWFLTSIFFNYMTIKWIKSTFNWCYCLLFMKLFLYVYTVCMFVYSCICVLKCFQVQKLLVNFNLFYFRNGIIDDKKSFLSAMWNSYPVCTHHTLIGCQNYVLIV